MMRQFISCASKQFLRLEVHLRTSSWCVIKPLFLWLSWASWSMSIGTCWGWCGEPQWHDGWAHWSNSSSFRFWGFQWRVHHVLHCKVSPLFLSDEDENFLYCPTLEIALTFSSVCSWNRYASAFYGPFREALDSNPRFGDKKTWAALLSFLLLLSLLVLLCWSSLHSLYLPRYLSFFVSVSLLSYFSITQLIPLSPPLLPSSATQNSLDNLRTFILSIPLPSSSTQNSLNNLRTFILSLSTCMFISISLLSVSCFSPLLFTMSVSISFSISLLFFLLLCLLSSSVQICIHFFSSSSLSSLSFLLSCYFSLPFSSSLIISQSVYLSRVLLPLSPPYLFFFSTSLFPPL